jgi:hypothetical protein
MILSAGAKVRRFRMQIIMTITHSIFCTKASYYPQTYHFIIEFDEIFGSFIRKYLKFINEILPISILKIADFS